MWASDRCGDPRSGADAGAVSKDRDALAFTEPDDPVGAGRGQVVGPAWQGGRKPQNPADWVGHDLDVHPVAAVPGGVVRPAVAEAVACGEGAVEQDEVRIGFT